MLQCIYLTVQQKINFSLMASPLGAGKTAVVKEVHGKNLGRKLTLPL